MGVKMYRQTGLFFECLDQRIRRLRLTQTRHVFDTEHVGAGGLQFTRQLEVVVERVFTLVGAAQIPGVAQRGLAQFPRLKHGIDGHAHVRCPVERVKDAKHIDARRRRLLHEVPHGVVRVIGIAHGIRRPQQHL